MHFWSSLHLFRYIAPYFNQKILEYNKDRLYSGIFTHSPYTCTFTYMIHVIHFMLQGLFKNLKKDIIHNKNSEIIVNQLHLYDILKPPLNQSYVIWTYTTYTPLQKFGWWNDKSGEMTYLIWGCNTKPTLFF